MPVAGFQSRADRVVAYRVVGLQKSPQSEPGHKDAVVELNVRNVGSADIRIGVGGGSLEYGCQNYSQREQVFFHLDFYLQNYR